MLRGALIGFGNIAVRGHLPALQGDENLRSAVEITSVVDVVPENRVKIGEHLPGASFYSTVDELLAAERPDFVDICSPPHTHADLLRTFGERGVHILCEKPLTEVLHTAESAAAALRRNGVVFVPCHQYKYSPLWRTIKDNIRSGALGSVTMAQFNVFRLQADTGAAAWNPAWRTNKRHAGGGILVDTGAHYFYLAQYFFGMPARVSAVTRTLKHQSYGVEDTAIVTLDYGTTVMQVNLTWAAGHRANSAMVVGSTGALSYDGNTLQRTDAAGTQALPMPNVADKTQYVGWYVSLFTEFFRRVRDKIHDDDLLVESVNVMRLLDACYRSSETGKTIAL